MPWKRCVFHIPCGERFRSLVAYGPLPRNHINVLERNERLLMEQAHANESLFYRC